MDIYQTIGMGWLILTSTFGTVAFFYFAVKAMKQYQKDAVRGESERDLDVRDAARMRDGGYREWRRAKSFVSGSAINAASGAILEKRCWICYLAGRGR